MTILPEVDMQDNYHELSKIAGESLSMKKTLTLVDRAAKMHNVNVLISGEEGTGKSLIAKTIHFASVRCSSPFVTISMSAFPNDLLESELFGYEKYAFEDAGIARTGKIAEAEKGTLFIENIELMPAELQYSFFQFLSSGSFVRVGGLSRQKLDVRVICSSTVDLAEEVRAKRFREDLYFRLMVMPIHLPSLKERQKDIVFLADSFLDDFCKTNSLERMELSAPAKRKMLSYSFPGNVRELKAVVELAAVLTNSRLIEDEHIFFNGQRIVSELLSEELTLKQYNERIIRHYMEKYRNVLLVAEKLDIGKSTIYNLLKKWKEDETP